MRLDTAGPSASVQPGPLAELARLLATVPLEGVAYETASVARLEPTGLVLRDGGIALGHRFPLGETLMASDPDNARVVISQRQILLFGPPARGRSGASTGSPFFLCGLF